MSLSQSQVKPKFLVDENVKRRLEKFLMAEGFDVVRAPRGVSNGKLAELSKSEKRVLVTNDSDLVNPVSFSKEKVFSVVLLAIPQNKPDAFLKAFSMLLKDKPIGEDFEGNLIVLEENEFKVLPISSTSTK